MEMYLNLQRGEEDLELLVEFTSYRGDRKGNPEDPDEIDIISVLEDVEFEPVEVELTEKETQNIRDQIHQRLHERRNDRYKYNSDE